MSMFDKVMRRELDRLAGELLRRQEETDACLALYARREALRALCSRRRRCCIALAAWWLA